MVPKTVIEWARRSGETPVLHLEPSTVVLGEISSADERSSRSVTETRWYLRWAAPGSGAAHIHREERSDLGALPKGGWGEFVEASLHELHDALGWVLPPERTVAIVGSGVANPGPGSGLPPLPWRAEVESGPQGRRFSVVLGARRLFMGDISLRASKKRPGEWALRDRGSSYVAYMRAAEAELLKLGRIDVGGL